MKRNAVALTFALLFSLALAGRPQLPQYSIVDLGLLPGGTFAEAHDVNNRGQIVGSGDNAAGNFRAILWENGQVIDLGTLGGALSRAWGINDRGQIVGETDVDPEWHAFLWQRGEMFDLAEAGPFNRAFAINGRAEIVGHYQFDALLWRRGILTNLGILSAVDINDRGVIVGNDTTSGTFHAVVWNDGEVTDLGTLPGDTSSAARAINNVGQVVGESSGDDGIHAFVWDDGEMIQLPGFLESSVWARGINNRGQIVGASYTDPNVMGGAARGVLWTNGVPTNLGTLPGQPLSSAAAINDHGLIVGFSGGGGVQANDGRAVAWIPRR